MIYPKTFESKIGFDEIRSLLRERCLSTLGKGMVDVMAPSADAATVNEWLAQVREFRRLQEEADDFPMQYFFDVREAVSRLRLEGTRLDEGELFDLRRSLDTICGIVNYLNRSDSEDDERQTYPYPALHRLTEGVETFPQLVRRIDQILDKFGRIKDSASPELMNIRRELARTEGGISRTLYGILRSAQSEGLVDKDVTPAIRDGRLVIPVTQGLKRRIRGIVHDESASGKTVFIEPAEVVEANNRIRELEADERREIIRILTEFADKVRPHVRPILASYGFLAAIDNDPAIPDILSPESIEYMTRHVEHGLPIGWMNTTERGVWTRSGTLAGTSAMMKRQPNGYSWVFLTNTSCWKGSRFPSYIDRAVTQAMNTVDEWPTRDLFEMQNLSNEKLLVIH